MDLVRLSDSKTLVSPIESTNEGKQTTPPRESADTVVDSSPLPDKSRKRTNEESWEGIQTPQTSPRAARFHLRRSVTLAVMPEHDGQPPRDNPFQSSGDAFQTQPAVMEDNTSGPSLQPDSSFVTEVNDYQQQLELEYQNFERSLNERDTSASLKTMNWEELEKRYTEEISPCIDRERAIMEDFNARFAQFMLYMQVSNEHEADRAVKRLRTRVAVARNSETLLSQKQSHHSKVLEAFQSAMALLGNA